MQKRSNSILIVSHDGYMFPHYSYQSVGSFMSDYNYRVTGRKKDYNWRNLQFFFNEAEVDLETGLEVVSFEQGIFAGWKLIKFDSESEVRAYMFNKLDYPTKELKNEGIKELKNDRIEELKNDRIKELKNDRIEELKNEGIKELKNDRIEELKNDRIRELKNYRIKEVKKVIRSEVATKRNNNNNLLNNYKNVWEI